MPVKTLGAFILIIFMLLAVLVYSHQYTVVADSDNQTAITNAARNSMTESLNLGYARAFEEITIDEELAVESLIRMYSASSDFDDGARYVNIYEVKSDPAFIAVESYVSIDTPIKSMLQKLSTQEIDQSETITRSREVVIYEAKNITR